ncbi:hypothetical protein PG991_003208 [Apiospora marii]|uniref:Ankyrin n=1 Tax=Apiospora marii TaxID=335849 RepID=A0ABR1SHJ6_9PEZI
MGASPNFDPSTKAGGVLPSVLHIAAAVPGDELSGLLLEYGAKLHKPLTPGVYWSGRFLSPDPMSPLNIAIDFGRWSLVELLLSNGAPVRGNELLQAVKHDSKWGPDLPISLAQSLVQHGVDVNSKDDYGENALQICIRGRKPSLAKCLLRLGSQMDAYALTLMHPCISLDELESFERCRDAWDSGDTATLCALIGNNSITAHRVLELGAHQFCRLRCQQVHTSVMDHFLAVCQLIPTKLPDAYFSSSLLLSLVWALNVCPLYAEQKYQGFEQVLRQALSNRSTAHAIDANEKHALFIAINSSADRGKHMPMELILSTLFSAPTATVDPWYNPFVPLYTPPIEEYLDPRVQTQEPEAHNQRRLWKGHCTHILLQRQYRPNTAAGLTSVATCSILEVKQLVSLGFDPRRRYAWSLTALQCAVHQGRQDMAEFLLKEGVSVIACPPWKELTPRPHPECPKAICAEPGNKDRRTAFQYAVQAGNMEMIDLLLKYKASVNEPPARYAGATALQLAAIQGSIGITKKLIDLGADVNCPRAPYRGRTALEGAAEHGRLDTVVLLLEVGCRIDREGRDQYIRAVKLARDNDHVAIASLLESRGRWTREDELSLEACEINEEEYQDLHEKCAGPCCSISTSVYESPDEPRCWESRSGAFDGDISLHDEDYTMQDDHGMQESPYESAVVKGGKDQFYSACSLQLEVQPGVEGHTGGVLFDNSDTVGPMSSWGDWAFDDDGIVADSL